MCRPMALTSLHAELSALQAKRTQIDAAITSLERTISAIAAMEGKPGPTKSAPKAAAPQKRRKRSPAAKAAQSEGMRKYWARRHALEKKAKKKA